jgi:hypothetical protein
MPTLAQDLTFYGALVEISVGWSVKDATKQQPLGLSVPLPRQATALLDTGAEVTCIDKELSNALALPLEGFTAANLPAMGGLSISTMLSASMTLIHPTGQRRNNLAIRSIGVLELSLGNLPFQALIGRDILARCRFTFDGPGYKFRLVY